MRKIYLNQKISSFLGSVVGVSIFLIAMSVFSSASFSEVSAARKRSLLDQLNNLGDTPSSKKLSTPSGKKTNNAANCNIKGNISFSSGEKFYHLPGMPEYEITKITLSKGERFFCSEAEAINNGWRKAPR